MTIRNGDEGGTMSVGQMSWERLFPDGDPDSPPGAWRCALPDGSTFDWQGFYEGPCEMSRAELGAAARDLLGLELGEVARAAARALRPSSADGGSSRSFVLHSATPILKSLQGDTADARNGRTPDDVAAYVETRAVSLARPGDVVVGRTYTWRVAAHLAEVEAIRVPGVDWYYLSQAIIQVILGTGGRATSIQRMVRFLRDRPDTVVRLYSLDVETQIVLLYLQRAAELPFLWTDANSPDVASRWNTKAPLHPTVLDCAALAVPAGDPFAALEMETERAPMRSELGLAFSRLPGYVVNAAGETAEAVAEELLLAARMLRERYGVTVGCLKPSEGGGGARIRPGLSLGDEQMLVSLAPALWRTGELYVLEAQTDYLEARLGGRHMRLAPSAHVRYGRVADGITLQLTNGTSWQGNAYLDEKTCGDAGLTIQQYHEILNWVRSLRSVLADRGESLVTGGIDFAVGRVGGAFGDHVFVAVQDPNLSSHGAEYLRQFLDELRADGGDEYAATKVICPTAAGTLPAIRGHDHGSSVPGRRFKVIGAIPGRWGMIAASGISPHTSVEEVFAFEKDLVGRGLTFEAPPR